MASECFNCGNEEVDVPEGTKQILCDATIVVAPCDKAEQQANAYVLEQIRSYLCATNAAGMTCADVLDCIQTPSYGIYNNDADAAVNGVAIGEVYELSATNTYGNCEGLHKTRRN